MTDKNKVNQSLNFRSKFIGKSLDFRYGGGGEFLNTSGDRVEYDF